MKGRDLADMTTSLPRGRDGGGLFGDVAVGAMDGEGGGGVVVPVIPL